MNYRKQTRDACLAYSLLQLGRVSERAVKEYEKLIEANDYHCTIDDVGPWLKKHAPEIKAAWDANGYMLPYKEDKPVPAGAGVAVVCGETPWSRFWHAVSYEDGKLLDSDCDLGYPESPDELKARWEAVATPAKLVAFFPITK